jgi:hypothetical protein
MNLAISFSRAASRSPRVLAGIPFALARYASSDTGTPQRAPPSSSASTQPSSPYGSSVPIGDESGFLAGDKNDWSRSYHGLSSQPFPKEVADILLAPVDPLDVEMKPGASVAAGITSVSYYALQMV